MLDRSYRFTLPTLDYRRLRSRYPYDRMGSEWEAVRMTSINVDYPNLLSEFPEHLAPKRSESASFLIWYLEKYYRLDTLEAIDAVCDQGGDKGVDAIFINDSDQTITIFQSKISHKNNSSVGDAQLRDFLGILAQFKNADSVNHLVATAGNAQVANLIKRSGLVDKLTTYELRGEFLVNIDLDKNGSDFLSHYGSEITFLGKSSLLSTYISDERDLPVHKPTAFDILGINVAEHIVDSDRKAVIAPIRARELVAMEGISDQSLFAYNVRGPLGRTKVNKDMVKSVKDNKIHKIFPLFHNGVTVITKRLNVTSDKIEIEDYYVVNGCQSISSLYDNRADITDDLKLLTKFIKLDPASAEAKMITEFSNNQNGVRPRDFKSNNAIQIRLRREFTENFAQEFTYEIKRGETPGTGQPISNEEAGLYLMAFDHREPWATHRKYEVFEDKHSSLFGRPEVTADRIVLLRLIADEVARGMSTLEDKLFAGYILTKYMILYVIREMFDSDSKFEDVLANPQDYVRGSVEREKLKKCIAVFVNDIIIDLNLESKDFGEDFDYRGRLRDATWVKELTRKLKGDFMKSVNRGKQRSFSDEWAHLNG